MSRSRKTRRVRRGKNILNQTVQKSANIVKGASRKYMPKVESSLENVGSKVIRTSKRSVPFLQRLTRKLFSKIPFLK
jgi:hypothetical protein